MGTNTFLPRKTGVYLPFACLFFFFSLLVKSSPPKWERSSKQRRLFDFTLGIFLRHSPSAEQTLLLGWETVSMPFYTHTGIQPDRSDWQTLENHLQGVADLSLDPSKNNPFPLAPLKSPSWVPIPAKKRSVLPLELSLAQSLPLPKTRFKTRFNTPIPNSSNHQS